MNARRGVFFRRLEVSGITHFDCKLDVPKTVKGVTN